MNSKIKPILMGNIYLDDTHGGFGGDVFHESGICRNLGASIGGGAACTFVMLKTPAILVRQRTEEAKARRRIYGDKGAKFSQDKEYTIRQDGMSNTITTVEKDNLLVEPQACAIRTHNYRDEPTRIIMGGEVANSLTSVQKDSMVLEPKIVGYTRDEKGKVIGHHLKDESNTLHTGGGSTMQYVAEPIRVRTATTLGYDECPVGGGFDAAYPSSELRRGRVQDGGNVVGALTAHGDAHCVYEGQIKQKTNSIAMEQVQYRIRKLTPVETGRLMGMDDADIHKMLGPVDDKGKPIISKSQAYKLHGNSIVVDVLYHIFHKMLIDTKASTPQQLTLF